MHLHKEKLTDNIELSTISTDKFKSSVISFSITLPLKKEDVAYGLLLSHLLCRGSASYPSIALLNKRLDELYGSYVEVKSLSVGENLALVVSAETLDNKYVPEELDVMGEVIDIIAELILSPAFLLPDFNLQIFEQEKRLIEDSINAEINNTKVYSLKKCVELIRESTEIPTSEELKEIVIGATYERLTEYYCRLISNAPINIFCISAESLDKLKKKIISAFEKYPCVKPTPILPLRPLSLSAPKFKTQKMPVSQGKLSLGFTSDFVISENDDSYYAMIMLNEIFGGSATSKLFTNVREKMSLCYSCSSVYSLYNGSLIVFSGFEVKNYETVKRAILAQLDEIKNGNISDAELCSAQRSTVSSYRQLYDSPFDLQAFFVNRALFGISDGVADAEKKLLSVTKEDIIAVAQKLRLEASFFVEGSLDGERSESEEANDD